MHNGYKLVALRPIRRKSSRLDMSAATRRVMAPILPFSKALLDPGTISFFRIRIA